MLVPPKTLFLLGLVVWGTFFFELSFDPHFAVAELCRREPFSSAAFQWQWTAGRILLLGMAVGLVGFGVLSDRFGRFHVLLWCLALGPLFSALGAISLSIFDFLLLRFLTGAALGGLVLCFLVLYFEVRDPLRYRRWLPPGVVLLLMAGTAVSSSAAMTDSWRPMILASGLPTLFVLLFRRLYDEPTPWKVAVRDVPQERRAPIFPRLFRQVGLRRLVAAVLLSTALAAASYGIAEVAQPRLRDSVRYENSLCHRDRTDLLEDAALIAYLLRFPQLLSTREIGETDLGSLPEKLLPTADDLPECLLHGLLGRNVDRRPTDRDSLIDAALVSWNLRNGNGRPMDRIPLDEIDRFWRSAERFLAMGDEYLESKHIVPDASRGALSGANLWEARKSVLKTLLRELDQRRETRHRAEQRSLAGFLLRFLAGGCFGLLLWVPCLKRLKIRKTLLLSGSAGFVATVGLPLFTPSPLDTEYAALTVFSTLLGFCTLPFSATVCASLPDRFSCAVRASGTGLALAGGIVIAILFFHAPSEPWAAAAVPALIGLGIFAAASRSISTISKSPG